MPLIASGLPTANPVMETTPSLLVPAAGGGSVRTRFCNVQGCPQVRVVVERLANGGGAVAGMTLRLYRRTGPLATNLQATNYTIAIPAAAPGTIEELVADHVAAGDITAVLEATSGTATATVRVTISATG